MFKVLGAGTYNVVIGDLTKAYRIALYDKNEDQVELALIKRGHGILRYFSESRLQEMLGPALLRGVTNMIISKTLSPEFLSALDEDHKDALLSRAEDFYYKMMERVPSRTFYVHEMERLGQLIATARFVSETCFIMTWFLAVAQTKTGFSHRDLKSKNMGARGKPENELLGFQLGEQKFQIANLPVVPVLYDYDFASINATSTKDARRHFGTVYTAPPELFAAAIGNSDLDFHVESASDVYFLDAALDWWSLGIVLFHLHVCKIYAETFSRSIGRVGGRFRNASENIEYLGNIVALHHFVMETTTIEKLLPEVYRERYPKAYALIQSAFEDETFVKNAREFYKDDAAAFRALSVDQQEFFRRILSLDPEERTFYGNPFQYFELDVFRAFRVPRFSGPVKPQNMAVVETVNSANDTTKYLSASSALSMFPSIQQQKLDFLQNSE